jgi:hypothetical protein
MTAVVATSRSPISSAALAVSAACQYISKKRLVPERIISMQARRVPQ